jgi:membrane associated rhomboid family serine protease
MPTVTKFLVGANVVASLVQLAVPGLIVPFGLWPFSAASATGGQAGFEPWQIVTYAFLHGSLVHLAFNMLALYMFGGALEQVVGPRRYTAFYLVSVLAAALTQLVVTAASGTIFPTIGASGGVFGVLLAYAVYFPRNKVYFFFVPVGIPARVAVFVYAAVELVLGVTGTQEGVAHFAHLGGLVGGALMLALWRRSRFLR